MDPLIVIPALGDNFIYLYRFSQNSTFVVDPSDFSSVLNTLEKHTLNLETILVTHHHWDHLAGAAELKKKTGCRIIGSDKERIPGIDDVINDGQTITTGDIKIQVIATPGHTRTSVCYYMPPSNTNNTGIVWTGDTLFVGGCGRLLECNAETMWNSLCKLASLPDQTLVCCGHDYTVENYEFALTVEPNNKAVKQCLQRVKQAQKEKRPTAPSTILKEKKTNPFLRANEVVFKNALNLPHAGPVEIFAELRCRKDVF
jgi:hydroxyacylglutathione hydrolase